MLNYPAVLPFITKVFAWGTQKWMKLGLKVFSVKTLHVWMEVKKAQKQGRDYTTQKKIILILEELYFCSTHLMG